jgi:hypothetical protein
MPQPITYPAGSLVRVGQICTKPGKGDEPARPGLLPISRATWFRWVKDGHVKPGQAISSQTVVWPVEYVLSLGAKPPQES